MGWSLLLWGLQYCEVRKMEQLREKSGRQQETLQTAKAMRTVKQGVVAVSRVGADCRM